MLHISVVQLKALLNVKLLINAYTFLLGERLNLFTHGYLQCNNGERIVLIDVILEKPGASDQAREMPIPLKLQPFMEPCHCKISSVNRNTNPSGTIAPPHKSP